MKPQKNALEWGVFVVSLVLIVVCVALLAMQIRSGSSRSRADLVITAETPVETSSGFLVPVTVENKGKASASDVEAEASLVLDGTTVETGGFVLPYAPGESRRKAAVMFTRDPDCCRLELRIRGFVEP